MAKVKIKQEEEVLMETKKESKKFGEQELIQNPTVAVKIYKWGKGKRCEILQKIRQELLIYWSEKNWYSLSNVIVEIKAKDDIF